MPHSSSSSSADETSTRVANLNTSRPFIATKCSPADRRSVARAAGRQVEVHPAAAVGAELEAEETLRARPLQHDRAGAIAE